MPKGPKGQKRPADVIKNAVHVMRVATGEAEDVQLADARKGVAGGRHGGRARAKALSPAERTEIARLAAEARWKKGR